MTPALRDGGRNGNNLGFDFNMYKLFKDLVLRYGTMRAGEVVKEGAGKWMIYTLTIKEEKEKLLL